MTCTRSNVLAVNTSYPAISITVSVAQSAAASLINTATVSGGGDANTTNNSASDSTTVEDAPRLLLVKRITDVNGVSMPQTSPLFQDLTLGSQAADDNHPNWALPASVYLRGELNHNNVKPGDEIEYTIYFLNTQNAAKNVRLCDIVPDNTYLQGITVLHLTLLSLVHYLQIQELRSHYILTAWQLYLILHYRQYI